MAKSKKNVKGDKRIEGNREAVADERRDIVASIWPSLLRGIVGNSPTCVKGM
jgi:hypothetical protein